MILNNITDNSAKSKQQAINTCFEGQLLENKTRTMEYADNINSANLVSV